MANMMHHSGYHQYPTQTAHRSVDGSYSLPSMSGSTLGTDSCDLSIRQQPKEVLAVAEGKAKARKPVDPPPILELNVSAHADPAQNYLQSPYLFVAVSLFKPDVDEPHDASGEKSLTGTLVSSLHKLKDTTNKDGAFFIFGDISVKATGRFRLHFRLYEFQDREVRFLGAVNSAVFNSLPGKDFKGMEESTYLSRAFSDQGVRLRLRKEARNASSGKRAFPYANDAADTPIRPNVASGYGQTYNDTSAPPNKRFKSEQDDRKDSFPEGASVSVQNYVPTPSYQTNLVYPPSSYSVTRQSIPPPSENYVGMNLHQNFSSNIGSINASYTSRTNYTRTPSNMMSSSPTQDGSNGIYASVTQGLPGPFYTNFSQPSVTPSVADFSGYDHQNHFGRFENN